MGQELLISWVSDLYVDSNVILESFIIYDGQWRKISWSTNQSHYTLVYCYI